MGGVDRRYSVKRGRTAPRHGPAALNRREYSHNYTTLSILLNAHRWLSWLDSTTTTTAMHAFFLPRTFSHSHPNAALPPHSAYPTQANSPAAPRPARLCLCGLANRPRPRGCGGGRRRDQQQLLAILNELALREVNGAHDAARGRLDHVLRRVREGVMCGMWEAEGGVW